MVPFCKLTKLRRNVKGLQGEVNTFLFKDFYFLFIFTNCLNKKKKQAVKQKTKMVELGVRNSRKGEGVA